MQRLADVRRVPVLFEGCRALSVDCTIHFRDRRDTSCVLQRSILQCSIYRYLREHSVLYLIYVYTKNEQDALLPNQKRAFKRLADTIRNEWARKEHDG